MKLNLTKSEKQGVVLIASVLPVFFYATTQFVRIGTEGNHYRLMMISSVLSIACVVAYMLASRNQRGINRTGLTGGLLAALTAIPYLLGFYLIFYQGIWGFTEFQFGFTVWAGLKAIASVFLGYMVVSKMYSVTTIDRRTAQKVEKDKKAEATSEE